MQGEKEQRLQQQRQKEKGRRRCQSRSVEEWKSTRNLLIIDYWSHLGRGRGPRFLIVVRARYFNESATRVRSCLEEEYPKFARATLHPSLHKVELDLVRVHADFDNRKEKTSFLQTKIDTLSAGYSNVLTK
jgi:archaellum component FlaC